MTWTADELDAITRAVEDEWPQALKQYVYFHNPACLEEAQSLMLQAVDPRWLETATPQELASLVRTAVEGIKEREDRADAELMMLLGEWEPRDRQQRLH
ncbi:hypothetical protein BXY66_3869 [Shimia isoporae]|uniref:Uncharacterized protein n=1 Tax=Shimia isoporae TaxID=647720 RepID=A0A4R1N0I5_9RHOB|nr:hypothetical protein [Shimia isoporae]TCK99367.1 hypothetical protein BXY66_3869 [Shimia isoporae]